MKRVVAAAAAVAAALTVTAAGAQAAKQHPSKVKPACGATLGVISPVTGQAATIGQEIVNWTRLAVANWNKSNHTRFTLVEGDDQLSAAEASTVAQQFASNHKIVGIVGPAASQNVAAAGPILNRAHMAMVSPSATQTSLTTSGTLPNFFRVVARDDAQAPTAANYMIQTLHPKRVMIIDDQSSFSTGLADAAGAIFTKAGISVDRESVSQQATDYSSLAAKAGSADVVYLTWQLPANIKLFVQQLHAQGKTMPTFASALDGDATYVSSFSINVHTYAPDAALRKQYEAKYGANYTGEFGPPSYVAAQVLMKAVGSLCRTHKAITRPNVLTAVRKVRIPHSIIGRTIAFDKHGDLVNGRFYLYKLVGDSYQLIG
jgi:branched-chain amino acid transport system substrate-binding protein